MKMWQRLISNFFGFATTLIFLLEAFSSVTQMNVGRVIRFRRMII